MPKSSTVLFVVSAAKDLLKEKRLLLSAAAITGLFLVFAVFTAPLFSMIAFTPIGGGFTQWFVVDGGDNNPYYLMQQAYAQEPEPEVQELVPEEGGGTATPPLTASITIDSTNGDTAPATFLFETEAEGGTEPYTYSWNFGDGSPQVNEQNIDHTFENPGTYVVILTVTDSTGQTVSDRREVSVRPAGAAITTTPEEPQPPTNATSTPTPQPTEPGATPNQGPAVEQNQTETLEPVEAISCPPNLIAGAPIVLKSGNGPIGTTDPLNQFSTDGGITWSRAFIVQKLPVYHLISGTQYISSTPNLSGTPNSDTWYQVSFTLPSGFSNSSLNIQIHADNAATIYLNPTTPLPSPNNQIGAQPQTPSVSNFQDLPESFDTSSPALFKPGTNTLYFRITNFDRQTAFDYLANVAYCIQPATGGRPGAVPGPITGPVPGGNVTCPAKNVQHWDKIIFQISDAGVAASLGLPTESMLDIKVLDDPKTVADIEKKVLDFLKLPDNPQNRNAIFVIDVEYAIICASS